MTALYHFLFVPLTLGLSALVATMETVYFFTNKPIWRQMTKFWGTLFGINFVLGVSTGIVMEFQFGMNWSYYSHYVGDIFGAPLAIEGLMAFFLESTFVGLFFFGWDRMSKGAHLIATWCVALGSNFSALWILIANGWMQFPEGSRFVPETMRMEVASFADVLFNPVAQTAFVHTVSAGYLTAAIFVIGVSAWYLLKGRHQEIARRSIATATAFGLCAALSVVYLGDESGHEVAKLQPLKVAAMEGEWDTEPAPASFKLLAFPDQESMENKGAIEIPWVMGLIATRSLNTEVPGIKEVAFGERKDEHGNIVKTEYNSMMKRVRNGLIAYEGFQEVREKHKGNFTNAPQELQDRIRAHIKDYGYALLLRGPTGANAGIPPTLKSAEISDEQIRAVVKDALPNVSLNFWSFRLMVGIGFYLLLFVITFFFLSARGTLEKRRWLLKLAVLSIPLPWIACELGWIVAEMGRQPWIIEGVLPTVAAHSELSVDNLLLTIGGFALIYTVLIIVEMMLMLKGIRKGPQPEPGVTNVLPGQLKTAAAE